mmetsp:Transcript_28544/g.51673  ORF Transcript_28544/g.51673 Transcript_28544/m.51673 type:complete len:391 (+) Transcript_28544:115-1287(+)|eukprot:CAMPEP_0197649760 /NCGR_PEP_ID=MMETSP1338-20131121/29636_1 /TAXON_ID=43686 ORGANISM="Pelagodinium beii, Strain RCC1491" /NCGR_SAMPLE_ID=MMETSP1338 /ASSEMBLY_ACC=CAM_ASM_000754 /LENGTH=390 /DNA_ID=CAMNT_0043224025 /DNA_START=92 /DNA_END=1264 /DNA_ORIENTATION=-
MSDGGNCLDWPLSQDEKKCCVMRFYERELNENDELLSRVARDKARFRRMSQELGSIGSDGSSIQSESYIPVAAEMEATTAKAAESEAKMKVAPASGSPEKTPIGSPEKTPEASKALVDRDGRRVASMGSRRFQAQDDSQIWQKNKSKSMSAMPDLKLDDEEEAQKQPDEVADLPAPGNEVQDLASSENEDLRKQMACMMRTLESLQMRIHVQEGQENLNPVSREESEEPVNQVVELPSRGRSEPRAPVSPALKNPAKPRRRSRGGDSLSVRFEETDDEDSKVDRRHSASQRGRSGYAGAQVNQNQNQSQSYDGATAVMGVSGGIAGATLGGTIGATIGIVPALFTFGLSIPIGAAVGASVGTFSGSAIGIASSGLLNRSGSTSNLNANGR